MVADVRPGEGLQVAILALNVFILLGGYYLLKTVREALILTEQGAAVKTYASAAQALLLMAVIPLFGRLASKVNRLRLIAGVLVFFISNLVVFFLLGTSGKSTGVFFFIWVGVFNVMAIAQFWAFANDLFSEEQGKRLFPLVGVGSSLGAWLGALAASRLIKQFGPFPLMMMTAGMLVLCIGLTAVAQYRSKGRPERQDEAEQPLGEQGGFQLLLRDRYLLLIAVLMIVLNVVNTTGEFMLSKVVVNAAHAAAGSASKLAEERWIGGFYGNFFGWVNLLSFVLQTFFVYRIIRYLGIAGALFVLPAIALGSYAVMAAAPILGVVRLFKIAENSTDYSVQNTVYQALFLRTSREAKYKAKQVTDAFCMRLGDVVAAGVVFLGTTLQFGLRTFALLNIGMTALWFLVVALIARTYRAAGTPALHAPAQSSAVQEQAVY
jgi:AAA family ATP:ADP antiporter